MGRYTGFFALALLVIAAAVYGLLPQDGGSVAPEISITAPTIPPTSTAGLPSVDTTAPRRPASTFPKVPRGEGFDFYVLSLSWSPTFCASGSGASNGAQCGTGKRFGWVVHGLWPQNERGYPQDCATSEGSRVPDALARSMMDIMPSLGLIGHQWRKHGSCSGLSMTEYFAVVREAYGRIRIPAQFASVRQSTETTPTALEQAFIRSNPGLTRSAVAVTCDSQRVDEVRICLDTSLTFRTCQQVDQRSCKRSDLTIPPQP